MAKGEKARKVAPTYDWGNSATVLDLWKITEDELTQVIKLNPSLRGMIFGYVAEVKLMEVVKSLPNVTSVTKEVDSDRRKKGDLLVVYKGCEFRIEAKSLDTPKVKVLGDGVYSGQFQCNGSDSRKYKLDDGNEVTNNLLKVGEFDIVAVNLFEFGRKWTFAFAENTLLPRSKHKEYDESTRSSLLASSMPISYPLEDPYTDDLINLFEKIIRGRGCSSPAA